MLDRLFPAGVHTVTATPSAERLPSPPPPPLLPEEEPCIRRAVEKRRREFAAGRACARQALEACGIRNYPLLIGPDRAPVWPRGIVGSITHCEGFVGAAVARKGVIRGIGVDAERAEPLERELVRLVCTPREREWIDVVPPPLYTNWPKLLFSAKEAAYKCLAPLCERPLGFHDLEIVVHPSARRFAIRFHGDAPLPRTERPVLEGRFATSRQHVFTGVLLT
jgi:4'-phosphopantetheinyl transferase EntD